MLSLSHHSPSRMKKHLDQTQSRVSFLLSFSKSWRNDLWEWCGNQGEGVTLHTRRSLYQHWVVRKCDGLHWKGWLVYLIVTAASFQSSLPFWFYEVFLPPLVKSGAASPLLINPANLPTFHQLLQQCCLSVHSPFLNPLWLDVAGHHSVLLKQSNTSGALPRWRETQVQDRIKSTGD